MRITERAIELPRLVLLSALFLLGIGFAGVYTIPKERQPRVKVPVILVAVPNQGATPATNETQIVNKIEDEVEASLEDLRDDGAVLSQSVNGAAIVQFVFHQSVDVAEAKRDVESLINRVKGQFPPNAQQDPGPTVKDVAFEDFPIIQVVVSGGSEGEHRREVAEDLEQRIEKISGVAAVDVFGGLDREIQIEVNPHLMTLYGFNYRDVESAIRRANMDAPSGSIKSAGGEDHRVRSQTKLGSIEEIRQIPLGLRDGKPLILSDIAGVYMGHEPVKSLARYDSQDAVVLLVRAKTDIDVLATANKIQDLADRYMADGVAHGVRVSTVRSQAREIGYMLDQLLTSAGYGMVLIILILWISLGWRNASLISIAVPFSLLGSAAFMWLSRQVISDNLTINNMTIFGMILVTGLVVDGCIVVGENIYRHRELGRSPMDAAKQGVGEVGGSLVSAYLTTFAAFGPMFMVGGMVGEFMEQLPIVVMFALCAAILVDHFLLPVLSLYWMKVPAKWLEKNQENTQLREAMTPEQIEIANAEMAVSRSRVKRVYGRMLGYALQHRLLVLCLSGAMVVTPFVAFFSGAIGFEFFPDSDIPIVEVHFELALGSSLEVRTAKVAHQIEQAVLKSVRPEEWNHSQLGKPVRPVTTIGEPGALNSRFDVEDGTGPEFGMVYVELVLAEHRERSVSQIRRAIVEGLPPLPGVVVRVKSPQEGPPVGAPVVVRVLGRTDSSTTLDQLAQRAQHVKELLGAVPGTYDVNMDYRLRPELEVTPNRMVASLFDIDAARIATGINYALEGVRVGEVDFGGTEEIDMRLRNTPGERDQVEDLSNMPLRTSRGRVVSLDQVARIERVQSANVIRHYDKQRVINVRAHLEEGVLVDQVKRDLIAALRPDLSAAGQQALAMDRDHSVIWSDEQMLFDFGGENQDRDDALEDLNLALMIAAAAMMIILTFKFNSFIQPLIVLFSVPLSLVGVSLGLMLCGFYFSISAMIGVVALSGIVVNDAIVLVDFINRLRGTGIPIRQAVIYAGQLRLRPIFLTTVTTIGGLLPLGLNLAGGGEFFQPLTVTIMFGLGFATLLQLFIIPLLCYTFDYHSKMLDPADPTEGSDADTVSVAG